MNVFETFLPQLLLYPNASDPLNGEAAALLMRDPAAYNRKVKGARGGGGAGRGRAGGAGRGRERPLHWSLLGY